MDKAFEIHYAILLAGPDGVLDRAEDRHDPRGDSIVIWRPGRSGETKAGLTANCFCKTCAVSAVRGDGPVE